MRRSTLALAALTLAALLALQAGDALARAGGGGSRGSRSSSAPARPAPMSPSNPSSPSRLFRNGDRGVNRRDESLTFSQRLHRVDTSRPARGITWVPRFVPILAW